MNTKPKISTWKHSDFRHTYTYIKKPELFKISFEIESGIILWGFQSLPTTVYIVDVTIGIIVCLSDNINHFSTQEVSVNPGETHPGRVFLINFSNNRMAES